jgi:hypothetical protein
MSEERGVTSSQVPDEGTQARVTPKPGKGALDTRRLGGNRRHPDTELEKVRLGTQSKGICKPNLFGVYAC